MSTPFYQRPSINKMRLLTVIALTFVCNILHASGIKGSVELPGKSIALVAIADYISQEKDTLQLTRVNDDGTFEFTVSLTETKPLYLATIGRIVKLRVAPKTYYELYLKLPENLDDRLSKIELDLLSTTRETDQNELFSYADFQEFLQHFLEKNREQFMVQNADSSVQSFKQEAQKAFLAEGSETLPDFLTYNFALLDMYNGTSRKMLAEKLLANDSIHYHNEFYNTFLFQLYLDPLSKLMFKHQKFLEREMVNQPYEAIAEVLTYDSLLAARKDLREYLFLYIAQRRLHASSKGSEIWRLALQQFLGQSQFETHIRIANRILAKAKKLRPKTLAPALSWKNLDGTKQLLEEYRGKYVFVEFWASWNEASLKDLILLQSIASKFRKNIAFVAISIDYYPSNYASYAAAYSTKNLEIGHFDSDFKMLERYGIQTAPMTYLIDPNGYLLIAPADRPEAMYGLFQEFNQMNKSNRKPYELINDYQNDRIR